jgi:hypothetical protein
MPYVSSRYLPRPIVVPSYGSYDYPHSGYSSSSYHRSSYDHVPAPMYSAPLVPSYHHRSSSRPILVSSGGYPPSPYMGGAVMMDSRSHSRSRSRSRSRDGVRVAYSYGGY